MSVIVKDKDGRVITYGYATEHLADVNLFYAQLLADGLIESYEIVT
jgi:hypothetical protein